MILLEKLKWESKALKLNSVKFDFISHDLPEMVERCNGGFLESIFPDLKLMNNRISYINEMLMKFRETYKDEEK